MGGGDVTEDDVMQAIINALQPRKIPPDARSTEQICEAMGITKNQFYDYLKIAKIDGRIESVGRFGKFTYYRVKHD